MRQLRCILHTCTKTLALACWTAVIIAIIVNLMACLCREILPCKIQENIDLALKSLSKYYNIICNDMYILILCVLVYFPTHIAIISMGLYLVYFKGHRLNFLSFDVFHSLKALLI